MRYILLCCSLFVFFDSQAQQINPVPDYVFQNRMSVGRTAVTDTAAYISIGPRYGAIRGFMPPMVIDTASVTGTKRNGLLIFSIQKNKFLYWDSVRVQWSDMAGSSGSYITGTLTNRYIPKATGTTTLGNSLMYDSSSHVRAYGNWIGNNNSSRFLFQTEIDGQNGYGLKVQQNDSNDNNIQYVTTFRHGLVTSAKPRPEFGVGHDMSVQDDAGTFRRVGTILTRLTDTTAAGISAKMQFGVAKSGSIVTPLQIYSDSSVRMAKLAGSGSRYVVADANGDLTATSATTSTIGGSGTTNYISKFTASGTIGNSQIFDNGTNVGIGITSGMGELFNVANSSGNASASIATSAATSGAFLRIGNATNADGLYLGYNNPSGTLLGSVGGANGGAIMGYGSYPIGFGTNATERLRIFANGRVGVNTTTDAGYQFDVAGSIRNTTGANFATSSGEVFIATTTDAGDYKLQVSGNIYGTGSITTGAPTSGSAKPWKIGEAATVSPTSPNRTIRVEIDGTVYYIHAKTTND